MSSVSAASLLADSSADDDYLFEKEFFFPVSFYRRVDFNQSGSKSGLNKRLFLNRNVRQVISKPSRRWSQRTRELQCSTTALKSYDPKIYYHFIVPPSSSSKGNANQTRSRIQETRWLLCPFCRFAAFSPDTPRLGNIGIVKTVRETDPSIGEKEDEGKRKRPSSSWISSSSTDHQRGEQMMSDWSAETNITVAILIAHLLSCHEYMSFNAVKCSSTLSLHIAVRNVSLVRNLDDYCSDPLSRLLPVANSNQITDWSVNMKSVRKRKDIHAILAHFLNELNQKWPLESANMLDVKPRRTPVLITSSKRGLRKNNIDITSSTEELDESIVLSQISLPANPTREFFHRSFIPYSPSKDDSVVMGYDSENDEYDYALTAVADAQLAEFEDISSDEKVFMSLWNIFIKSFPPYSDGFIGVAVDLFAKRFAAVIVQRGLRYTFLLHMMYLWNVCLLRPDEMKKSILIIDQYQAKLLNKK